jgi:aminopeptidase-like protein
MRRRTEKAVKDELSGERAKSFVAQISQFHRVQASTMFHQAAKYVRDTLRDLGLKDAKIEQFLSDGHRKYWTWVSPIGWEVKSAELHLVEPEQEVLARFEDVPTCLHTYSNATPARGITAELVDVGEGTKPEHYEGKRVRDRFVLATGKAKAVHEQAVYKRRAAGVLTDSLTHEIRNVRESIDLPDAHAYQSIWPDKENLARTSFGFSLSKRQGNRLRTLLKESQVVKLRARVDARLFPSNLDVVTTTIRGSTKPDEELFLIAHLCHPQPGANDNASGSSLLLEIARTVKSLIRSRRINRPARTLRFLWVPETFGTVAYLYSHEAWLSKLVAGINLDMVGQNQELCQSTLNLDRTPDSNPSYLNDYIYNLLERTVEEFDEKTQVGPASTFRYSTNAFSGGSDHAEFNDSSFGIPCIMLLQWPDLYYHSSADDLSKVSADSLKRVGWIAAVAILTLANATVEDQIYIANLTREGAIRRLLRAGADGVAELLQEKDLNAVELARITLRFKHKIDHIVWRERRAINSLKRLGSSTHLDKFIAQYSEDVEKQGLAEIKRFEENLRWKQKTTGIALPPVEETEIEKEAKLTVPRRLFKGPLSLDALKRGLSEKDYRTHEEILKEDKEFRKKIYEIMNFMDGKRTAYEIANAVQAEYGHTSMMHVLRFVKNLEKAKLVSFKRRSRN